MSEVPKLVDHQERRRQIIEALWRIAARDGLGAVSIRAVATEAGVPAPQVQYYFGSKARLLNGALELLGERVVQRGLALMETAGADPPPEVLLRAALEGSQPTDDESRHDLILFFCFYIAALTNPSLSGTGPLAAQRWLPQYFASLIREAQQRSEIHEGIDPSHEANLILFANTGLLLGVLAGYCSADEATATMDYHLSKVFRRPDLAAPRTQTRR